MIWKELKYFHELQTKCDVIFCGVGAATKFSLGAASKSSCGSATLRFGLTKVLFQRIYRKFTAKNYEIVPCWKNMYISVSYKLE
jgi:hypothetical protein